MPTAVASLIAGALSVSATSTAVVVASNLLFYAATTAASYFLQQALAPEQEDPGVRAQVAFGEDVPQSFIVGRYATAGSLIYANTFGNAGKTPNAYLVQVFCLSDLPCEAMTSEIWVNNKKCVIDWGSSVTQGSPVTTFRRSGNDYMWVKFLDGTQTTAPSYLTTRFGADPKFPWTTDMIGRGRAIAIVTTRYQPELFNGLPNFIFVVDGAKLYDPRLDGTNGGTGAHRYTNQATHAFTRNAKVIDYNIARGIYYGSEWIYGGQGWPAHRLDNSTWFAAMNECDVNVSLKAGGTEKKFRIGAEIRVNDKPVDVMERINVSCSGRTAECGGVYKTYSGAYGASILSFTDDDIVVTTESQADAFPGHESWVNSIRATFVNPNDMWQAKTNQARTSTAYVTADGGQTLEQAISLDMVSSATQAMRVASLMLKEARRYRTHIIALPPEARKVEPLDVVSWTSTKFGYSAKKFIVGEVIRMRDGWLKVSLREVDPADFNWEPASDETDFTDAVFDDVEPAADTIAITVSAVTIKNNAGTARRPALKVQWTVDPDVQDVKAVRFRVRLATTAEIVFRDRTDDWEDGEHIIFGGAILPAEDYEVQAAWVPESTRKIAWSAWTAVTATTTRLATEDISNSAVTTVKVGASEISAKEFAETTGNIAVDEVGYQTVQSLTVNHGTDCERVILFCQMISRQSVNFNFRIRRGGTVIYGPFVVALYDQVPNIVMDVAAPGSGASSTFDFQLQRESAGTTNVSNRKIVALSLKR